MKTVSFCFLLFLSIMTSLLAIERTNLPSNRNDEFLLGHYGGIKKGDYLYGPSGVTYCALDCFSMCNDYGVDWIWYQANRPFDERTKEAVNKLKHQTRILAEVFWWNLQRIEKKKELSYNPKYGEKGPDWIDLADDPEAFEMAKKIIDSQIDPVINSCGKDAFYGVVLSEEEPTVRMFGDLQRDMKWFEKNKIEASKKIIYVANGFYRHLKNKYPGVKISQGFYPGLLYDPEKTLLYDIVVMDCYPQKENLKETVAKWLNCYPPSKEVYLLLWGRHDFDVSRKSDREFFDKVFKSFYDVGYRNIGFFAQEDKATLFDYTKMLGETKSRGTFLDDKENLKMILEIDKKKREKQAEVFKAISDYIPKSVWENVSNGQKFLKEAENAYSQNNLNKTSEYLIESAQRYHNAIEEAVSASEKIRTKILFLKTINKVAPMCGITLTSDQEMENAVFHRSKNILMNSCAFNFLPDFFNKTPVVLSYIKGQKEQLVKQLDKKLQSDEIRKMDPDQKGKCCDILEKLKEAINVEDDSLSISMAKSYSSSSSLLNLRLNFFNPYGHAAKCPIQIKTSNDRKEWTVAQDEKIFSQGKNTFETINVPLPTNTNYLKIEFGTGYWNGNIGLTQFQLITKNKMNTLKILEKQGDILVCKKGDSVTLDVGYGKMSSIKMEEETMIVFCKGQPKSGEFPYIIFGVESVENKISKE